MFIVKLFPELTAWHDGLTDTIVRSVVAGKRLALRLIGDVELVGEGASESRIHLGAGWPCPSRSAAHN
jgi:putative component of toxin-antitoxin plasmid stabilization module